VRTIFALRALGIGDLVTGLPALRGLKAAYAEDHRLVLGVPRWLRPLAELAGVADTITEVAGLDGPVGDEARGPDIAVNLHGRGPQSHELLRTLSPGRLMAFRCGDFGDGPQWRPDEHEIRRWCRLLAYYGIPTDPADIRLQPPPSPTGLRGRTVIHPGAKDPQRRWTPDRFAEAARALTEDGHLVVVTGSAEDTALTRMVVERAGLDPAADLAGRLDLVQLAAVVADARLVISNDTGASHLASATGTPSVTLFATMDPALWGPPDKAYHRVIWKPRTGLDSITVTDVLAQVKLV
jgi:ADP-heptose:LPS heptosyltransferase